MAQRVRVMRAGYPYWKDGIKRKAEKNQEIVLHAHLAHVDHIKGKVQILGRHIATPSGATPPAQPGPEPKRRGRPPKKKGFFGSGE